jgi:hypothetical protein
MRSTLLIGATFFFASFCCAAPPEQAFDVAIVHGRIAGERVLRVTRDDGVRLRVTSDAPGELHLHGYRIEAKVRPGAVADIRFTAYATGRYPFEWHPAAPAPPPAHHAPPLAVLEVRPR